MNNPKEPTLLKPQYLYAFTTTFNEDLESLSTELTTNPLTKLG